MVGQVFVAIFQYDVGGEFCFTKIYVKQTAAGPAKLPTESLAVGLNSSWTPKLRLAWSEDVTLSAITVRTVTPPRLIPTTMILVAKGQRFQSACPPCTGIVLTSYARHQHAPFGFTRRSNQWSGVGEEDQKDGRMLEPVLNIWADVAALYQLNIIGFDGSVWRPVVKEANGEHVDTIDTTFVNPSLTSMKTRHQRRHLPPL